MKSKYLKLCGEIDGTHDHLVRYMKTPDQVIVRTVDLSAELQILATHDHLVRYMKTPRGEIEDPGNTCSNQGIRDPLSNVARHRDDGKFHIVVGADVLNI